jgi:hypothetical protein
MNTFTFEAKHKTLFLGAIGLGLLCMILTFVTDDALHTRFWTNYLHNTVFFTGIAFISLFIIAAFTTAWAGWYVQFKRIYEAFSMFLIPGLLLMIPIIAGLWGHFHHLYHWGDAAEVAKDPILAGKSSFLNPTWYTMGTLIIMGIWIFFAWKLRQLSLDEDVNGTADYKHHHTIRIWSAAFLPIAGFSSAAIIWQWIMSIDAHWYSTLFAWYTGASWFVAASALVVGLLLYMKSKGYYQSVTTEHLHDLGKYVFAFSIFWTYLWFSQFMLIWYANVGEETVYFQERMQDYPVLFYGNLALNFVAPFFLLMRNDTKRKNGTLILTSIIVFFGHWLDFFLMIKPGALHTAHEALAHMGGDHGGEHHAAEAAHDAAHHASSFTAGFTIPGLLELGTMIGFFGLFLYVAFYMLSKAPVVPEKDPYLEESMHHHV